MGQRPILSEVFWIFICQQTNSKDIAGQSAKKLWSWARGQYSPKYLDLEPPVSAITTSDTEIKKSCPVEGLYSVEGAPSMTVQG